MERANLFGAIVPHAPVLLPAVGEHPDSAGLAAVRAALGRVHAEADVVVVASPHGRGAGVYSRAAGDLRAFGLDLDIEWARDGDLSRALVHEWGMPMLRDAPDHGVSVPLSMLPLGPAPVVTAAFEEGSDPGEQAVSLALAVATIALERRVLFVASANGSPGMTARGPLTEVEGAAELEDALIEGIQQDCATLRVSAPALSARAGSCGLGPLLAFAQLFSGRAAQVTAHEAPFGVGYVVATVQ